ncbi:MAG TPA: FmdE family protein [Acidimicrobiales bacterium]|jgi:formylmethanofuran dehydrogenase subunit E|nr:FmdE family protein [Acidimicrobiales bacterium]
MTIEPQILDRIVEFHGHLCPGLAMGVQAAQIALREVGPHSKDEEVVAVTETDMCGVDAIQFLTGCTFGKGNLIHRDWGKNAYTFFRRSDGKGVRIAGRPDAWRRDPQHQALFAKVRAGEATAEERARFQDLHEAQSRQVLEMAPDELFSCEDVEGPPPPMARIHTTVICDECGEGTMETRINLLGERQLCTTCYEAAR